MAHGCGDSNRETKENRLEDICLHVGDIPWSIDEKTFEKLFSKCGPIEGIKLYSDRRFPCQLGKIKFSTNEASMTAMLMYHKTSPYFMSVLIDRKYHFVRDTSLDCPHRRSGQRGNRSPRSKSSCQGSQTNDMMESSEGSSSCGKSGQKPEIVFRSENRLVPATSGEAFSINPVISLSKIRAREIAPVPSISLDVPTSVNIVFINSPHSFYVQLPKVERFEVFFDYFYSSSESLPDLNVNIDDIVAAKNRKNDIWYRAKIIMINPNETYHVKFIDYGIEEDIHFGDVRILPEAIAIRPPQALHCGLANVLPANRKHWTVNDIETFKKLTKNKFFKAKGVKIDDVYWVCLIDEDDIDVGRLLASATGCTHAFPIMSGVVESWETKDKIPAITSTVDAPGHFWVVDNSEDMFGKVLTRLNEICDTQAPESSGQLITGSVVAAKKPKNERYWFRAVILTEQPKGWIVQDLDCGNKITVEVIRPLPFESRLYPALGVSLTAPGLEDRNRVLKPHPSLNLNVKLCSEVVNIVDIVDEDGCHSYTAMSVWLELRSVWANKTVSKTTWKPDQANSCLLSICDSFEAMMKEGTDSQLPTQHLNCQKEYPIDLSFYDRGGGLYVQLMTEENKQRMHMMTETLDAICERNAKAQQEQLEISISQILCAKCTENNEWYRCEVLNIESHNSIEVRFVDHGHTRFIPATRLIEIPEKYRRYPPIAVSVILDDIPPHLLDQAVIILEREPNISWKMRVVNDKSHPISVIISSSEDKFLKDFVMESLTTTTSEVELKSSSPPTNAAKRYAKSPYLNESDIGKLSLSPTVTTTEKCPSAAYYYDDVATTILPVGRSVTVMFVSVHAPLVMYCWAGNIDAVVDRLVELSDQMTKVFESELATNASDGYIPELGEVCAAKYKDGHWYRAACLERGLSDCKVIYVDYGDDAVVPYFEIKRIRPEFMNEAIQGIFCRIDGITDSLTFGLDDCKKFKKLVPISVPFKVEVVSYDETCQQYTIRIPSVDTDGFIKDKMI